MDVKMFDTLDGGEIKLVNMEMIVDNGFDTSVYISLFTEKNWWEDTELGSQLYTIKKNSQENRVKMSQFIKESLQWMIDENIADSITTELTDILQNGVVYDIIISQPDQQIRYKYSENWEAQQKSLERL